MFFTIKKVYYDEIKAGNKTIEYRAINARTIKLLSREYSQIAFHYYRPHHILCQIIKVRKIKTPARMAGEHGMTEHCLAIYLGKTREVFK